MSSPEAVIDNGLPTSTCFMAGTLVHTDYGVTEIEYLEVGSLVLSRSEITGEQCYRRVTKTFMHHGREIYHVIYATSDGKIDALLTTAEHQFWVKNIGWTEAVCLESGQQLEICDPDGRDDVDRPLGHQQWLALSGGRWSAKVVSVTKLSFKAPIVYNFEVEDFHTYFVGVHGVLVHNKIRVF
ncbi:MAG: polymorphic toxin-type HINT domain-containing protein [Gallionella sp.]